MFSVRLPCTGLQVDTQITLLNKWCCSLGILLGVVAVVDQLVVYTRFPQYHCMDNRFVGNLRKEHMRDTQGHSHLAVPGCMCSASADTRSKLKGMEKYILGNLLDEEFALALVGVLTRCHCCQYNRILDMDNLLSILDMQVSHRCNVPLRIHNQLKQYKLYFT